MSTIWTDYFVLESNSNDWNGLINFIEVNNRLCNIWGDSQFYPKK